MHKEWTLTQAALDSLLAWLDPDRDRAGAKYEAIRTRLIKVFVCRGCPEAEDLADETINRVASKLIKQHPFCKFPSVTGAGGCSPSSDTLLAFPTLR